MVQTVLQTLPSKSIEDLLKDESLFRGLVNTSVNNLTAYDKHNIKDLIGQAGFINNMSLIYLRVLQELDAKETFNGTEKNMGSTKA